MEVVRVLLEYSVNVNKSDVAKITPLHSAAGRGFVDIVRLLLTAGADVNLASERGSTPLHEASWGGHVEVLHDKGSSSDASGACHVAIVRLLLEYQADINFSDSWHLSVGLRTAGLKGRGSALECLELGIT